MVSVRIWSKPWEKPIELQARTLFKCDKCWQYSPKLKCMKCYPSKCFPLFCEKERPDPKKDFEKYKKWDSWYLWRYLLAPSMDEEEKYSIGSEWFGEYIKAYKYP